MGKQANAFLRKTEKAELKRVMKDYTIRKDNFQGEMVTIYVSKLDPTVKLIAWRPESLKKMFNDFLTKPGNTEFKLWATLSAWMHEQAALDAMHEEWATHCFQNAMQFWDDGYTPPTIEIPNLLGA